MNGIDIASYQKGIDLSIVPCDFVIIKATQGLNYVNPDFVRAANEGYFNGKLVGAYHYITGAGATAEAKHFIETTKPYHGRILLCLDWENQENKYGKNAAWPNSSYCIQMATVIFQETGILPVLYMSKSYCRSQKWDGANCFPLWVAQYANKKETGYQDMPWTDEKGLGPWKSAIIHQYSSTGRLNGWSGNLDLNKAYISADEWTRLCNPLGKNIIQKAQISEYKNGAFYKININDNSLLNIRAAASAKSADMGDLKRDCVVKIDKVEGDWGHFEGWINLKYAKKI